MRIITLMPTRGLIFTKAEQALEQELLANEQVPFTLRTDNLPIPDCRNVLADTALTVPEWTHVLMIDDDVILPEGGLKQMIDLNTDIAFIDYPMHYTGDRWGHMGTATYDNWLPGEDHKNKPVAWAGLGCCLVKREVFEKLPKPLFKTTQHTFERDENGHITIHEDHNEWGGGGEDTHFFIEAKKAGFDIKPVNDIYCGHARLVKSVLTLQNGKYKKQHQIAVNGKVECPYR